MLKRVKGIVINIKALPESYWINTSGNDIVNKLIEKEDDNTRNEIEAYQWKNNRKIIKCKHNIQRVR